MPYFAGKRITRKRAERLIVQQQIMVNNFHMLLLNPNPHVCHVTVAEAVEWLAALYKNPCRMKPVRLQYCLNRAASQMLYRPTVFFHVEGAPLPAFDWPSLPPTQLADIWEEVEHMQRQVDRTRANLLGI